MSEDRGANDAGRLDLWRETGSALGANLLYFGLGLGVVAVLARRLGTGGAGRYFLVVGLAGIAGVPLAGVGSALRKRGSEVGTNVCAYLGIAVVALVGYALLVATAGSLVGAAAPGLLGEAVSGLVGLAVLGRFGNRIGAKHLDAVGRPALSSWTHTLREAATLAGFVLAPLATFRAAVLYRVAVGLAVGVGAVAYTRRPPTTASRAEIASLWAFARWKAIEKVGMKARRELPIVLLGVVASPAAVTLFEAANRIVKVGSTATTSVTNPVFVKLSSQSSAGDRGERVVEFAYDLAPAVPFAVLVWVVLAGHEAVTAVLGTPAPASAATAVVVLAVAKVGYAYYDAGKMVLYALDEPKRVATIAVGTTAVAAVAQPAAAAVDGVVGVAAAVAAVTWLTAVCYTVSTGAEGYDVPTPLSGRYVVAAAVGIAVGSITGGLLGGLCGVAAYVTVAGVSLRRGGAATPT